MLNVVIFTNQNLSGSSLFLLTSNCNYLERIRRRSSRRALEAVDEQTGQERRTVIHQWGRRIGGSLLLWARHSTHVTDTVPSQKHCTLLELAATFLILVLFMSFRGVVFKFVSHLDENVTYSYTRFTFVSFDLLVFSYGSLK